MAAALTAMMGGAAGGAGAAGAAGAGAGAAAGAAGAGGAGAAAGGLGGGIAGLAKIGGAGANGFNALAGLGNLMETTQGFLNPMSGDFDVAALLSSKRRGENRDMAKDAELATPGRSGNQLLDVLGLLFGDQQ
jgi:hypothetical protein